jgi:hypothetical protein
MRIHRAISVLLAGATSMLLGTLSAGAQPLSQTTVCPVASNELVSNVMGAPASLADPDFGVTVDGSDTECLFLADGHLVLVRREASYFSGGPAGSVTPENADQLRLLVADDLDYVPVSGVGDTALWATVRDRSLAPQRMGVLISKVGTDAFAIGVMDTPEALSTATTLTQAVVAAQVP